MKIVFIGQKGIPAQTGGVERHVEFLATHLANLGHDVLVYNRAHYTSEKLSNFKGVRLVYKAFINNKNLANISHTFLASLDVLRRQSDIIHYHGVGPSLLLWIPKLFLPKTKIVATLHSFDYDNDKWSSFAKQMLRLGERLMCKFADQIIVLTPLTQQYLLKKYQRESTLISNGTELKDEDSNNQEGLATWNLKDKEYIFTASRLIRLKGIQYLINAYKDLDTEKKLVIAGEGEYAEELKKLAKGDDRILFIGNQTGLVLRQLYSHAYLFVQASEMEGMSLSLLEAMGHGVPCLASDIYGNKESLADAGFYFRSKDTQDLKNKLVDILENKDKTELMAGRSFARAVKEYDWREVVRKTVLVYESLLNSK